MKYQSADGYWSHHEYHRLSSNNVIYKCRYLTYPWLPIGVVYQCLEIEPKLFRPVGQLILSQVRGLIKWYCNGGTMSDTICEIHSPSRSDQNQSNPRQRRWILTWRVPRTDISNGMRMRRTHVWGAPRGPPGHRWGRTYVGLLLISRLCSSKNVSYSADRLPFALPEQSELCSPHKTNNSNLRQARQSRFARNSCWQSPHFYTSQPSAWLLCTFSLVLDSCEPIPVNLIFKFLKLYLNVASEIWSNINVQRSSFTPFTLYVVLHPRGISPFTCFMHRLYHILPSFPRHQFTPQLTVRSALPPHFLFASVFEHLLAGYIGGLQGSGRYI